MRYFSMFGLLLIALMLLGCGRHTQPPTAPTADQPNSNGQKPLADDSAAASDSDEEEADGEVDFHFDLDIGKNGVRVETGRQDGKPGVDVRVDPEGGVNVDVGAESSSQP